MVTWNHVHSSSNTDIFSISGEQTTSLHDITPPVLDQTLACLEIKIDVDEIDNLMEAGEEHFPEKLCLLYSKTRKTGTANLPEFKDVNEFNPGSLENPSNLSVKEEEIDKKGKSYSKDNV